VNSCCTKYVLLRGASIECTAFPDKDILRKFAIVDGVRGCGETYKVKKCMSAPGPKKKNLFVGSPEGVLVGFLSFFFNS
jgi:hypothetical protein